MRILPLLFVLGALSLRPALAQSKAKATPILYSRDLPKSVLLLMPRGAKSLFWGTFMPKKGSARMAIYLFNRTSNESDESSVHSLQANLFLWQKRQWHKIKSVPVEYLSGFGGTVKTVNVQFLWLDLQRKKPLFKMRIFDPNGFNGSIGDEVAVVFPHGFPAPAKTQAWTWGSWMSSTSFGQFLDWSHRDNNGFLEIRVKELVNDQFTPNRVTIWRWRKDEFSAL